MNAIDNGQLTMDNRLMRTKFQNEKGQIILLLILVMTVVLAIGISVIQRSISDISTASKVEQSSRAYSAAEAGIEKALGTGNPVTPFDLPNNARVDNVFDSGLIPVVPPAGSRQDPLEYPLVAKESPLQIWLADLRSTDNPPPEFYTQNTLDVYWGNSSTDLAAIELTLVYHNGSQYMSRKWYLDQTTRTPDNNFDTSASCSNTGYSIGPDNNYYRCKKTLGDNTGLNNGPLSSGLMLLRARLLYNNTSQPFAAQAVGICPLGSTSTQCEAYSLPKQARILVSTGASGATQRKVRLFQEYKVVPPYFDFAIFSADAINK